MKVCVSMHDMYVTLCTEHIDGLRLLTLILKQINK